MRATTKPGIWQARSRLGSQAMERLYEETVKPIAGARTRGAWFNRPTIVHPRRSVVRRKNLRVRLRFPLARDLPCIEPFSRKYSWNACRDATIVATSVA